MNVYKYLILLLISIFVFNNNANAGHLVGGEMTYECLGGNNYRFTLVMYRDYFASGSSVATAFDPTATITIFEGGTEFIKFRTNLTDSLFIDPYLNEPCVDPPSNVRVVKGRYVFTRNLPFSSQGYTIVHQRCCRNPSIVNITNPTQTGGTYMVELTPTAMQQCNNAPVYNEFPPIVICNSLPFSFDHSATDADGNTLVYSFCNPLEGGGDDLTNDGSPNSVIPFPATAPPYNNVVHVPPYSASDPMGGSPQITINPNSGLIEGTPLAVGRYVVAVCVSEYDAAGNLLSTVHRDFQFNVYNCTVNVYADIAGDVLVNNGQVHQLEVCDEAATVNFMNTSTDKTKIFAYEWQFDLGGGNIQTSTLENPSMTFPGYGTYDVMLIANPALQGCRDTANISVAIYPEVTASYGFTIPNPCENLPVAFLDQSYSGGTPPIALTNWDWDFGDGTTDVLQNPSHLFQQAGSLDITLTVTDANGCQDDTTQTIQWFPAAIVDVQVPNVHLCEPANLVLTNNSIPINGYDILWDLGNGTTSTDLSPSVSYSAGTYDIQLTMTSPIGCVTDTTFATITVDETPTADYTYLPITPSIFAPTVTFTDASTDAYAWYWDYGNGVGSHQRNPVYTFPDTGYYAVTLVAYGPTGCPDSITKIVDIAPLYTYYIANAFTPDGDGYNDDFPGVGFFYAINDFEMSVWNRWGEKIFEADSPYTGWNGRKNNTGAPCQAGVYVYVVEIKGPRGQRQSLKGFVTLVR